VVTSAEYMHHNRK